MSWRKERPWRRFCGKPDWLSRVISRGGPAPRGAPARVAPYPGFQGLRGAPRGPCRRGPRDRDVRALAHLRPQVVEAERHLQGTLRQGPVEPEPPVDPGGI